MDQAFKARLKQLIVSHEGYKNHVYTDSVGKLTVGIGYNLTDRGMPDSWINQQYDEDVAYFDQKLRKDFDWYDALCDARKMVLIDMCFMGYQSFLGFERMLQALRYGDYEKAALEILNSQWAHQVGYKRARQDADMMLEGTECSPQA